MNILLSVCALIVLAIIIFVLEYYGIKSNTDDEKEEIGYLFIPKLSRTIICVDCINGSFRSNIGDIIETYTDNKGKRSYYIHAYAGYFRLTMKQIKRLEFDYNIRIL